MFNINTIIAPDLKNIGFKRLLIKLIFRHNPQPVNAKVNRFLSLFDA